jgi:hypothetical protein
MLGQILGGVASGLLGGIFGQKASDNASSRQANAMQQSTAMQVAENRRQFDKMLELTAPQRQMFGPAGRYLQDNAAQGIETDVNWNLQNDPIYQQQQEEMQRQFNRRYAGMGRGASSDADNAMVRNMGGLMTDSYNRALSDLARRNLRKRYLLAAQHEQRPDWIRRRPGRRPERYADGRPERRGIRPAGQRTCSNLRGSGRKPAKFLEQHGRNGPGRNEQLHAVQCHAE